MPWFKVDDAFWSHEKVIELSPEAGWLWTRAGSYCAHHLTDGLVKRQVLALLGSTPEIAAELVSAGLWDRASDGFCFHDWAEYQPTRDEVQTKRDAWKERQRKARMSRSDTQRDSHRDSREESRMESTSPVPSRPVPISNEIEEPLSDASASDGSLIPPDWRPNQTHIDKAASLHLDVKREYQRFRQSAESKHRRLKNWNAGFTNWLRKQAEFAQQRGGSQAPTSKPTPMQKLNAIEEAARRLEAQQVKELE